MSDPFFIIVLLAVVAVAIVLLFGLGGYGKGGDFNRKYANKLMRLRILAQFIAVLMILAFIWMRGSN